MAEFIEIARGEPVEVEVPLRHAAADASATQMEAGSRTGEACLHFRVLRREVGGDGGVSLELFGPPEPPNAPGDAPGPETQLLRFDLFRSDPHFHIPASETAPTGHLEADDHAALIAQTLARAESELAEWLQQAGHPQLAEALGTEPVRGLAESLRRAIATAPEPGPPMRVELTAQVRHALGL
jgi:hypothetical protein